MHLITCCRILFELLKVHFTNSRASTVDQSYFGCVAKLVKKITSGHSLYCIKIL
ncbi:hypothetical protein KFK09_007102 [Dendrobium nobile]|uniref:Uncharacterized protein n=1 Tax=Dendrobium nobile TaxID=94219 RepID=A0A8T3BR94_DENNO|nr:hypothetical protein KFK09_007102 [Dendrobium nobile]